MEALKLTKCRHYSNSCKIEFKYLGMLNNNNLGVLLFNRKALEDFYKLLNKSNSQNIAKVCCFKIPEKTPKPKGLFGNIPLSSS
jgi:hypothetical protein